MRKNKHIRPNMYGTILEVDLKDGTTIIIEPTRINFGHNDFDTALTWYEKADPEEPPVGSIVETDTGIWVREPDWNGKSRWYCKEKPAHASYKTLLKRKGFRIWKISKENSENGGTK